MGCPEATTGVDELAIVIRMEVSTPPDAPGEGHVSKGGTAEPPESSIPSAAPVGSLAESEPPAGSAGWPSLASPSSAVPSARVTLGPQDTEPATANQHNP